MAKKIFYLYLFSIHIVIAVLLIESNIVERVVDKFDNQGFDKNVNYYINSMYAFQRYQAQQMSEGHNFLIGDSIAQSLNTLNLNETVINWGIGHNTTSHLQNAMNDLPYLSAAKNVIVIIGINDITSSNSAEEVFTNLKGIFSHFQASTKIFVVSVVQVNRAIKNAEKINNEVDTLNRLLKEFTVVNNSVDFIDLNEALLNEHGLNNKYDRGDGLHLNNKAYMVLTNILNKEVFNAK